MRASSYLVAALVFAVPSSAFTGHQDTLLALNTFQPPGMPGTEYGRFFDVAARKPHINLTEPPARLDLARPAYYRMSLPKATATAAI